MLWLSGHGDIQAPKKNIKKGRKTFHKIYNVNYEKQKMITDFCVICGTKDKLQIHHIVPKSAPHNIKPIGHMDDPTNLLTLCTDHHGWIHGCRPNQWNNAKTLQAEGVRKAKLAGKYKGRKPTARALGTEIAKLHTEGKKPSVIAKELNIGVASVYRYRHTAGK